MQNGQFMSLLGNSNNERQQSSLIKTNILNYVFIQINYKSSILIFTVNFVIHLNKT